MRSTGRRLPLLLSVAGVVALGACSRAPDYLELEPTNHTFKAVGEDVWWRAIGRTQGGARVAKVQVVWSTSDAKVVTIDEKGRARAVGPGMAKIVAKVGRVQAETPIEVVTVGRVEVAPKALALEPRGEPGQLAIKVYDYAGRQLVNRGELVRCANENVCRAIGTAVYPVDAGETVAVVSSEGTKVEVPVKVGRGSVHRAGRRTRSP